MPLIYSGETTYVDTIFYKYINTSSGRTTQFTKMSFCNENRIGRRTEKISVGTIDKQVDISMVNKPKVKVVGGARGYTWNELKKNMHKYNHTLDH